MTIILKSVPTVDMVSVDVKHHVYVTVDYVGLLTTDYSSLFVDD